MKLLNLFICYGDAVPGHQLDHEVTHCVAMDATDVKPDSLRYWNGVDTWPFESLHRGGVLVVPTDAQLGLQDVADVLVFSDDPKASFFRAMRELHHTWIDIIGMPFNGPKVVLAYSTLHSYVEVLGSLKVGFNTIIGGIGFGFTEGIRNPHMGGVILHDDVEIGSNTCIDRGTLGDTVIGARTKIDNLVHIAHNVRIGTDCQIVAGAVIGGSAVLGDRVFVGINASIKNKVRIGDDAVIGMGAVVTKDVPAGATVVGNPARILEKKEPLEPCRPVCPRCYTSAGLTSSSPSDGDEVLYHCGKCEFTFHTGTQQQP